MAIQGIFASNMGMVGDRTGDFANAILKMQPTGTALLLALTSGMPKEGAADTVFTWFEDSHISGRSATVSGGTSTTVVVADGSFYVPGTVLLVEETNEVMLVTATSGNSLTVIRGMGGTSIVTFSNAHHVQDIGNAHEEASGIPVAVSQQGHPRMNYTQIFRNSWAVTGTAKAVQFRTGNKVAANKRDCASYHAEGMERAFLWGVKHISIVNNQQFRMTDGVLKQIRDNGGVVLSAASDDGGGATAGELSMEDLQGWMMNLFATNVKGQPNERIVLSGNWVVKAIQKMVLLDSMYTVTQGESKVGIKVTVIETPWGDLKFMTHPLMNENPKWQKEAYALHPGAIRRRVLRDTFEEGYDKNGNRIDGKDADQGVITTEVGIEVGAASVMGILENVQKGIKTV